MKQPVASELVIGMCRLFGLVVPTRMGRQLNGPLVAEAAAGEQDTTQLGVLAEKFHKVALRYWMQVQCWGSTCDLTSGDRPRNAWFAETQTRPATSTTDLGLSVGRMMSICGMGTHPIRSGQSKPPKITSQGLL